jgi:hypothetical protein
MRTTKQTPVVDMQKNKKKGIKICYCKKKSQKDKTGEKNGTKKLKNRKQLTKWQYKVVIY